MYGSALNADGLGNTQVGGTDGGGINTKVAFRFKATRSAALTSIRFFLQAGSGYAGGTGGRLEVTVQSDDGSSSHRPSGVILAAQSFSPGSGSTIGYLLTFGSPPSLTAGAHYHIVFRNIDPLPTVNFTSVNMLYSSTVTSPRQPGYSDTDWAMLIHQGSWAVRGNFTPILDLGYGSQHAGVGYMEAWVANPQTISGASRVRETITPTGRDQVVTSISVRLRRVVGGSPVIIRIENGNGSLIEQGAVLAGTSQDWVTYSFLAPRTLAAGQTYRLVLSTTSDTAYATHVIREGSAYGYDPATRFVDGYAEYTTGGAWLGIEAPWGGNAGQGDLQFYFR